MESNHHDTKVKLGAKSNHTLKLILELTVHIMYDDYRPEPNYRRYPKVPLDRRVAAFAIDFLCVWFISSFFASNLFFQWLVLLPTWLIWRVIIADKNLGQSLGRWALDTKIIDPRFNRLPELKALVKSSLLISG